MAEIARRQGAAVFVAHRIARIYPMFWIASALAMAAFHLAGSPSALSLFGALLVPAGPVGQPLGVEWSLVYEVTFYGVVAAAIALGAAHRLHLVGIAWALAAYAAQLAGWGSPTDGDYRALEVLLSGRTIAFAVGLAIPWALERGRPPLALLVLPIGAFAAYAYLPFRLSESICGLAAPLVLAVAIDRLRGRAFGPLSAAATRLGDWSYALYLCHGPVVRLALDRAHGRVPTAAWLAAVASALLGAAILGPLDVALYRAGKARLRAAPRPLVGCLAALFAIALVAGVLRSLAVSPT